MKIEITPERITEFNQVGKPAIITIGAKNIVFNPPTIKMLGLEAGSCFLFEFEDGNLYYKESATGFNLSLSKKPGILMKNQTGIGKYIDGFFKKGLSTYHFSIGEFANGRRKLQIINS